MPKLTARERPVLAFTCLIALALLLAISLVPTVGGAPVHAEGESASEPAFSEAPSTSEEPPQEEPCSAGDSVGPLPSGGLSISGVVSDGVDGIPNIEVRISASGFGLDRVYTGADGSYEMSELGDGTYTVAFYDQSGAYQTGYKGTAGLVLTPAEAEPIELAGSSAIVNVVLPTEQLFTISGTVTDTDSAVSGVKLNAVSPSFPLVGCDTTAGDGTYTMPDVRVGAYLISVQDPSGVHPDGYYADDELGNFSVLRSAATLVRVEGNVGPIDIEFPDTFSVSGTVSDGSAGVGGISLNACLEGGEACRFASTEGDGTFIATGLVPGTYTIFEYGAPTYLNGYYAGLGAFSVDEGDAASVIVSDDVSGLELLVVLAPTATGTVTNSDGDGVGNIYVSLSSEFDGAYAYTDPDGTYTTTGLQPGTYTLQVSDSDYPPSYPTGYLGDNDSFVVDPADATPIVVDLNDLSNLSGLDVEMPDGGSIDVSVATGGAPAPYAYVDVCQAEDFCAISGQAENGEASISAIFPGPYFVRATVDFEHYYWYVSDEEVSEDFGAATSVSVIANASAEITLALPSPGTDTPPCAGAECEPIPLDDGTGATPVELTFENVESGGTTSLTIPSEEPTVPGGFKFGDPPTYYEITTTAILAEGSSYTICVTFDPGAFENPAGVRLFHFVSDPSPGAWEDTTLPGYPVDGVVCGEADSFSPFALIERELAFAGFFGVKAPPHVNEARAGGLIGIQFSLGGDVGLDIFQSGSPTVGQVDCTTGAAIGGSAAAASGTPSLKFNAKTQRYTYQWKTDKAWKNTCQRLVLTFRDGSSAEVIFHFKK